MFRHLSTTLFPLNPPQRVRKDDRPMQVLALGLSRSGTDSLRNALKVLGYANVYHGFVITGTQREDCAFWYPHLLSKVGQLSKSRLPRAPLLQGIDFDSVLGNSEAITDAPANVMGEELLKYYPEATVILNRRRDIEAWHRSIVSNFMPVFGWPMWVLSWFDSGIFWLWKVFHLAQIDYYGGSLIENGKKGYVEHYRRLETALWEEKRQYLDWSVDDGWEPLCRFLGKEVPDVPFPSGNKAGTEFEMNMETALQDAVKNAVRNIGITLASLTIIGLAFWVPGRYGLTRMD